MRIRQTGIFLAAALLIGCLSGCGGEPLTPDSSVKPVVTGDITSTCLKAPAKVSVNGVEAQFWQDSDGETVYIRTLLPEGSTETDLQNAVVEISGKDVSVQGMEPNEDGDFEGVDLYNKAWDVTIGGRDYVLAAGVAEGEFEAPEDDPLSICSLTVAGEPAEIFLWCEQSPLMGNPSEEQWTKLGYYLVVRQPTDGDSTNVVANLELAPGATLSAESTCYKNDLGGAPVLNLRAGNPNLIVEKDGQQRVYELLIL